MSRRYIPIFTALDAKYEADACRPLKEAVDREELCMHALARAQYPGMRLPHNSLRGLKSIGFWDAVRAQTWGLDWHRNEGLEITFCETGHVDFAADTRQYQLSAMDLTITRPWQLHRLGNPNVQASRLYWVIIDVGVRRPNQPWRWPEWLILSEQDSAELTQLLRRCEQVVWPGEKLYSCFREIGDALACGNQSSAISAVAICINRVLLSMLQLLREESSTDNQAQSDSRRTVELFLNDLSANLGAVSREWNVDAMADACGLRKTQFVAYCRQVTNLSPSRYLQQCRLTHAANQLRKNANARIIDVAIECGFTSSQYFATKFREYTGHTPIDYQRMNGP